MFMRNRMEAYRNNPHLEKLRTSISWEESNVCFSETRLL